MMAFGLPLASLHGSGVFRRLSPAAPISCEREIRTVVACASVLILYTFPLFIYKTPIPLLSIILHCVRVVFVNGWVRNKPCPAWWVQR